MESFEFSNPTQIIFGDNSHHVLVDKVSQRYKKILLVYGKNSAKSSGLLEELSYAFHQKGAEIIEWGGVSANPLLSHTREGIGVAKEHAVDAIVAVGGGSVLDEAKAIAAGICYDGDVWDFYTRKAIITQAIPLYTILTLAATGSEMNGNSVITNEQTSQKYNINSPYIYPMSSALNPQLTVSVPSSYLAYSAVDAISHVIEGYFTKQEPNPFVDRLCESVILTIMESTEVLLKEPENLFARGQFMWASCLALNGLMQAGLKGFSFPNHIIELPLSGKYNIAHGAGLSIVIPAWMRWYHERNEKQFERFSERIFGLKGKDAGIESLKAWFKSIGAPISLADVGLTQKEIPELARMGTELAQLRGGLQKVYTPEVIETILKGAL